MILVFYILMVIGDWNVKAAQGAATKPPRGMYLGAVLLGSTFADMPFTPIQLESNGFNFAEWR